MFFSSVQPWSLLLPVPFSSLHLLLGWNAPLAILGSFPFLLCATTSSLHRLETNPPGPSPVS
ncbi:hypothetical protein L228DRAFT_243674 [Xylona heveae TC161]|uniref:Uncharacterized protein n=1 Tax=Xylona heveae (strain CBS 132557 / TC161) TaxID=1328760 RepID=A0A165IHY6_XYLHT|nr:hypothetical protein L228DRAFT_243674 [Xylona heveae TC161]KZF24925.1 hypothetical protein L228DRAFT_243674 [Xylona heveae TC161]